MSKNVVERSWHTFRFLAFHRLIGSGAGLVLVWCWSGAGLVLTIYECPSVGFLCHVHHRREILINIQLNSLPDLSRLV